MATAPAQTFTAGWYGIGANFLLLNLRGSPQFNGTAPTFQVDWGDGRGDTVSPDIDTDGNGVADTARPAHGYASDGTYEITASSMQSGRPPVHLEAFTYANATNDITINATSFVDHMIMSGSGADTLTGNRVVDWIAGNDGNDTISGFGGDDFLLGGQGDDVIYGGLGNDLLGGNEGADTLYGGAGGDSMYGDAGDDKLYGGDGSDYLDGGTGRDILVGGGGSDTFAYDLLISATRLDRGVVRDFVQGEDHISLTPSTGSFTFVGEAAFDRQGPEVRYVSTNGNTFVWVDSDGNGKPDFSFKLAGQVALTADDFYFQSPPAASDAMRAQPVAVQADAADLHHDLSAAYVATADAGHLGYMLA